jgi:hypothetical protein
MRVVVPSNVEDCTLLQSVCQSQLVSFSHTDPVEECDLYQYEPQEWDGTGPFPELKYIGRGHPQWRVKNASK